MDASIKTGLIMIAVGSLAGGGYLSASENVLGIVVGVASGGVLFGAVAAITMAVYDHFRKQ